VEEKMKRIICLVFIFTAMAMNAFYIDDIPVMQYNSVMESFMESKISPDIDDDKEVTIYWNTALMRNAIVMDKKQNALFEAAVKKYYEWSEVAKREKVENLNKEIVDMSIKIHFRYGSSGEWHSGIAKVKIFFIVVPGGSYMMIAIGNAKSSENSFMETDIVSFLLDADMVGKFKNVLDPEYIKMKIAEHEKKNEKSGLFQ
jgi:hypothetical protein